MNKWHKLSSEFSRLNSLEERINLSLNGLPKDHPIDYPNVVERFKKYHGWLTSEQTLSIRFEDIVSVNNVKYLEQIADDYLSHYKGEFELSKADLISLFKKAIDTQKPHTFRSGKKDQWKEIYTNEMNEKYHEHLLNVFNNSEIANYKLI